MTFLWTTPPSVFVDGMAGYTTLTMDTLYALMVAEAPRIQQWMRDNAPWKDDCMPTREYLRADPWRDDANFQVGIVTYYDLVTYRSRCPEPEWDWGVAHETFTFKKAGVIAIISTRGAVSVLGDLADEVWDKVKALYS